MKLKTSIRAGSGTGSGFGIAHELQPPEQQTRLSGCRVLIFVDADRTTDRTWAVDITASLFGKCRGTPQRLEFSSHSRPEEQAPLAIVSDMVIIATYRGQEEFVRKLVKELRTTRPEIKIVIVTPEVRRIEPGLVDLVYGNSLLGKAGQTKFVGEIEAMLARQPKDQNEIEVPK
ncbi:hypothetical protein HZC07_06245 [Candidatus Micrarchaeota archaeon]|nr:hypothetical protein [Candidatus Micrarchaeota archaeon]